MRPYCPLSFKYNDMADKIEQPKIDIQEVFDNLLAEEPTEFTFRGKTHKMGWLHKKVYRLFTHISMKYKNSPTLGARLCAVILLNNVFKQFFFYPILWRYYYYIVDLDDVEVLRVIDVAKKKIPSTASQLVIIYSTAMTDLTMAMTKKEVKAFQAEHRGEQHTL